MTLSASKYELALKCPGSFALPWRDTPNAYSEAGSALHAVDELAIAAGGAPDAYTERWPEHHWRAEVAYAYDISLDTGRLLGVGINRAYGELAPFERPGTIDAEGWNEQSRHLVIVDRKSFEEQTPAAQNPQLRFLALAASRVLRPLRITVAINHQLHGMDVAELDAFDLDVIPHQLKEIEYGVARARLAARDGMMVPFNTGRHCRWCPAFANCPRQTELVALARRDDEDPELAMSTTVVDESDAPDVYQLWKRLGILHKRVGESLFALAASRPIPIGNGKMFGRVTKQGNEKLDGDVVYQTVKELHGQLVADAAVERKATKTKLKTALKMVAGPVAAAEREVLEVVRSKGGSQRDKKEVIEEFVPRLEAVTGDS